MKRLLIVLLLLAAPVQAQITVPNTLVDGTVIAAAALNTNFTTIANHALDRLSGGNLTGNITADPGVTIDGVDVGAQACLTCGPTFDHIVLSSISAASLSTTGGLTANSITVGAGGITINGVGLITAAGKIPALTSTYFVSLDGSNLTNLSATALTGSIADARLSANIPLLNNTNTFTSGQFYVRNLVAGAAQATYLGIGNDADAIAGFIRTLSTTFTPSGFTVADSTELLSERIGGLVVGTSIAAAPLRFVAGGAERGRAFASGGLSWGDTTDPGATNLRVAGTITSVGNINGTHVGSVATAAQPLITSVGTLTSLTVNGLLTVTGSGSSSAVAGDGTLILTGVTTPNQTSIKIAADVQVTNGGLGTSFRIEPSLGAGYSCASSADTGRMFIVLGSSSVADKFYVCLKDSSNARAFRLITVS